MRLTTSATGVRSPSAHSTCSICAPYLESWMSSADLALVVHWLPRGCVQPGSATAGNGNQACGLPAGLTISTRVVTSNLRQASGRGVNGSSADAPRGNAAVAANAAPPRKNSRRNMPRLPFLQMLAKTWISAPSAGHLHEQALENFRHVRSRPIDIAFGNKARFQRAVEHNSRRQRVNIPRPRNCAVPIKQDCKRQRFSGEEPAYRPVGLCHADRHDGKGAALEPGLQFSQACHFLPTRLAPGGEEMNEDDSAAQAAELVRRAVQARQRERRLGRI